ncbi:MAG: transglutaminase TgpA family protein, partial [Candidatus Limnocylindrales bacterium]
TGQFAAFAVFRRNRPMDAILVTGLAMLVNLSLTFQPEFTHLVVFATAALLLLIRSNLLKQHAGWLRRRTSEAGDVSDLFMRSGMIFVAVALSGALALTTFAAGAPLKGSWHGFDRTIVKIGDALNRIVGGVNAPARGPNALFSPDQLIPEHWVSSNEPVFSARTSDGAGYYWQAATYDAFDGQAWHQSQPAAVDVGANGDLLGPTQDAPTGGGRNEVTATVTAISLGGDLLLAPAAPISVDHATIVWTAGTAGPLVMAEFSDGMPDGETYVVKAAVRAKHEAAGGLTQYELAAAGQAYPGWLAPYLAIQPGSVGPLTASTADAIVQSLPSVQRDPFHVADAIQRYLGSTGGFSYSTDISGQCGSQVVECFLAAKVGFCEHFATAMIMLLRQEGIPARLVLGYLPGQAQKDGSWQVTQGAAHAWAEVYFPKYGWVAFDPTPGNRSNGQSPTQLDIGTPVATPGPSSSGGDVAAPGRTIRPDPTDIGAAVQGDGQSGNDPTGFYIIAAVLILLAVLLIIATRRERAKPPQPDSIYRGVARLAGWFGYGPRPTQTAYEYTAGLGELLPGVRPELQLVADAKVEATYARREPGPKARMALRRAYRRLRPALLRLALRARANPPDRLS